MRIAVDNRRGPGSGVGRLTRNLADFARGPHQWLFYGQGEAPLPAGAAHRPCRIPCHSLGDYFRFPALLLEDGADLYVAPQYYLAPLALCPTLRFVHDLWPLLHPEWIPSPADFAARYGAGRRRQALHFLHGFAASPAGRRRIAENAFVARFMEQERRNPVAAYLALMFLLALERAALVAAPSRHTLREIEAVFPEYAHKARLLPNAVSPLFCPAPLPRRDFLLHVAHWEPRKNIEVLLDAFALLRARGSALRLVLAGHPGSGAYGRYIAERIRAHPGAGSIQCTGRIPDSELARLYRQARAFVCPSLYEGFGIPPLEAMACGAPALCARAGAQPEVCGNAALYFDPADPGELAARLEQVLGDEALRESLVRRGLERARRFSVENARAAFMGMVEGLRAGYGARSAQRQAI